MAFEPQLPGHVPALGLQSLSTIGHPEFSAFSGDKRAVSRCKASLLSATALAGGVIAGMLVYKPLPAAAAEFYWSAGETDPSRSAAWKTVALNPFRLIDPSAPPTLQDDVYFLPHSPAAPTGFTGSRLKLPVFAANATYNYNSIDAVYTSSLGQNPLITVAGRLVVGESATELLANQGVYTNAISGKFEVQAFGIDVREGGSITSNGIKLDAGFPADPGPKLINSGSLFRRAGATGTNAYIQNGTSIGEITNNATGKIYMGINNAGTLTNNGGLIDGAIFNSGTVDINGGSVTGKGVGGIGINPLPEASTNSGNFTLRNGASLAGGLTVTGGNVSIAGESSLAGGLTLTGGNVSNSGGSILSGGLTMSDGTVTNVASTVNWYNARSSTVNGPVVVNGGVFNNQAGSLQIVSNWFDATGAAFVNGNVTVGALGTFNNHGIKEDASGNLRTLTLAFASGNGNTEGFYGTLYTNVAGVTGRIKGDVTSAGTFKNDGLIEGTITQTGGTFTNGPSVHGAYPEQRYLNGMIRGALTVTGGTFYNYGSTGNVTVSGGAYHVMADALVAGGVTLNSGSASNQGLVLHDTIINGATFTNYATGALRNTILTNGRLENVGVIGLPANGQVMSSLEVRAGATLVNYLGATIYGAINTAGDIFSSGTITGHVNMNGGNFTQSASQSSNIVMSNGANLYVGDVGSLALQTLSGVISGEGALTKKSGTNTVVLSGANTYSGGTVIRGGTLRLEGQGSLGSGFVQNNGGTLEFNLGAADYTINSHFNALANYGTPTFNTSVDRGITKKSGSGTLTIDGAFNNTLGGFEISGGSVVIGPNATLQPGLAGSIIWGLKFTNDATTTATFDTGAGSRYNNGTLTVIDLVGGAGAVLRGSGALNLEGTTGATNVFGGSLNGFNNITKLSDATTVLTGDNQISGKLTVISGKMEFASTASFGQISQVEVNGSGELAFNNSAAMAVSAPISGTGHLVKSGAGLLTLSGALTYSGKTTINAGTLAIAAGSSLATSSEVFLSQGGSLDVAGKVVINSGRVKHDGGTLYTGDTALTGSKMGFASTIAGDVIVARDAYVVFDTATDLTYAKVIAGEGGLIKEGTATLTLAGASTYSGTTTVSAGRLVLGANGRLSNDSTVFVATGAEFDLGSGTQTIKTLSGAGTVETDGSLTVNSNADQTFQGGVAGNDNTNFVKDGTGNLTITGNLIYGGTTTVQGGTLTLGGANDLQGGITISGHGSKLVLLSNNAAGGAIIRMTGSVLSLANAQTYTSNVVIASATSQLEVTAGTATLAGVISQDTAALAALAPPLTAGPVEKIGAGTLVLTGTNTYSGATTISAGTLSVGSSANLGDGSATNGIILNGGTLLISRSIIDTTRSLTVTAAGGTISTFGHLDLQNNGNVFDGQLTKTGSYGLVLLGSASGAGGIKVDEGRLTLGHNLAAGTGTITLSAANTSLASYRDGLNFANNVSLPGAGERRLASSTAGTGYTLSGVISGEGGLSVRDSVKVVLTGNNTFSGGVTAIEGSIGVGSNTALGTGALTLGNTLRSAANGLTIGNAVSLSGANAAFEVGSGHSMTMSGAVTQAAPGTGFKKIGSGTLILTSALTNDGLITVSEGTLSLTNGGNTLTGGFNVSGTLLIGATGAAGGAANRITTTGSTIALANGVNNATPITIGSNTTKIEVAGTDAATQSGVISQTGGARPLEKTGTGTLTLTGTNTYSGATTISGGTLVVNSSANLGDGSATNRLILNGGRLSTTAYINSPRLITVTANGGKISHSSNFDSTGNGNVFDGQLTKEGSGILRLIGSASGAGGINVTAGGLTLGHNTSAGTGAITLQSGTVLSNYYEGLNFANAIALPGTGERRLRSWDVDRQNFTLSGAISGEGSLRKQLGGVVNLTGNNTFSGGVVLESGTLGVGSNTALGTGTLTANTGTTLRAVATATLANNISLQLTGSSQFIVDTNGHNLTLGGAITTTTAANEATQPGLTKNGNGNLTLTGTNTYRGATIVNAGRLIVNGSISNSSSVTVANGAYLAGNATIPNMTVHSGATVSPGNSIGTINIGGNFVLNAGSTTVIELQQNLSDRILAGGTANINGTLQLVALGGPYTFTTPYTVISGTGGRTGTFSNITVDAAFGIGVLTTVSYNATSVLVTLSGAPLTVATANGPAIVAASPKNAFAVASGLDRALAGGADSAPFYGIYSQPTREALSQAVNTLSGEIHTTANAMGVQASDQFMRVMLNPLVLGRDSALFNASSPSAGRADQRSFQPGKPIGERRFAVWGAAYGEAANSASDGRNSGAARRTGSDGHVAVGADFVIAPGIVAGLAVSGGQANSKLKNGLGTSRADVYQVGLYSLGRLGAWNFGISGSYGSLQNKTSRAIPALGFGSVSADYRAESWSGRVETAYNLVRMGDFGVSPIAAFQAQSVHTPRFVERNGGAANLVSQGKTNVAARSELGVKFDYAATLGIAPVNFYVSAAWAHYASREAKFSASISGLANSGFTIEGTRPSRDAALIAVGADMEFGRNIHFGGSFNSELAPNHRSFSGSVKLRGAF